MEVGPWMWVPVTAAAVAAAGTAMQVARCELNARKTWRAGDHAGRQARLGNSPELPGGRTRLPR